MSKVYKESQRGAIKSKDLIKKMSPKVLMKMQRPNPIKEDVDDNVIQVQPVQSNKEEGPPAYEVLLNREKEKEDFDFNINH